MSTVGDLTTPAGYFTRPAPAAEPGLVEALARLTSADTTARAVRVQVADLRACQMWLDERQDPAQGGRCVAVVRAQIAAGFGSYRKKGETVLPGADLADYVDLLHRVHAASRWPASGPARLRAVAA